MQRADRISTIERLYPDQWVTIEVTRDSPSRGALAGRVLAHAPDEATITRAAVKAREEHPDSLLFTFYTGPLIPEGMTVIFGCL
jgi:hypothetical protein